VSRPGRESRKNRGADGSADRLQKEMQKEDEELFNDDEGDDDDDDGDHDDDDSLADELDALELQDALEADLSGVTTPAQLDELDEKDEPAEAELDEGEEQKTEEAEEEINAQPKLAGDKSGSDAQEAPTIPKPTEENGSDDESKEASEVGRSKGKSGEPLMSKKDKRRAKEKRKKEEQEAGTGGGTAVVSLAKVKRAHRIDMLIGGFVLACLQCLW